MDEKGSNCLLNANLVLKPDLFQKHFKSFKKKTNRPSLSITYYSYKAKGEREFNQFNYNLDIIEIFVTNEIVKSKR